MKLPIKYSEFIKKVETNKLYVLLVCQLNKDVQLANLSITFDENISPKKLFEELQSIVVNLLTNNYDDYLNFMYRVDVNEKLLKQVKTDNLNVAAKNITYLILKREYQKVWLKEQFK